MPQHMPELKQPFSARLRFAFGRQVVSNMNFGANAIEKLGALFLASLQRLYAAHTEKVQMRFAPVPGCTSRAAPGQRPFGL